MKKVKLDQIIKKHLRQISEGADAAEENYMFFGNIQQMQRQCEMLMQKDKDMIDNILSEHDWAQDHISEAKSLLDQVFDFLMNETKKMGGKSNMSLGFKVDPNTFSLNEDLLSEEYQIDESKNKPTNPKLWAACLSWAKSKYKVCPSAYCNGAAAKRYKSKGGTWRKSKK
jgi:hypothetical protein